LSPTSHLKPPPAGHSLPGAKQLRIVIADDDRDTAASLEALLNDEGHQTRCVYHGRDVLRMVDNFRADVVLLDIGMPGKNGYEVARELRERYGNATRIIAVTAWAKSAHKMLAEKVGFDHHLAKPYDPQELLALITLPMMPALLRRAKEPARRNPSRVRYTFTRHAGYLRAELTGRSTAAETEEFLQALAVEALQIGSRRLLISVRASDPIFRVEEYSLSEYLKLLLSNPGTRVALVADSPEVRAAHEYVETIAFQRGADVRSYVTEKDAVGWLLVDRDEAN